MKTGFMMRVKGRLRKDDGDFMTQMWTQKLCAVLAFKASYCASKLSRWVFCICVFTLFSWQKKETGIQFIKINIVTSVVKKGNMFRQA